ncbi:MAG: hypothetical protein GC192_14985 [Bacteroidetes bacterium]|nr:hypothetical protein [Bacteroidota bacterium]
MKNIFALLLLSASLTLILTSCQPDEIKYPDALIGTWTITKSERMGILSDGSVDKFEDIENAGTLDIFEATPPAETFKEFVFNYTNFQGDKVTLNSLIYTDEDKRRVSFSKVLCGSPFECDIVWTVEENKKNKQVWSTYGNEEAFFYPNDRYDPTDDDLHLKWRITLEK